MTKSSLDKEALRKKIAELQQQLAAAEEQELQDARDACEKAAAEVGHTVATLFGFRAKRGGGKRSSGGTVVKFRHPDGSVWSGKGRPPKWITAHEAAGGNRKEFAV